MGIAALITWLITAVGGFVMLGLWISRGGTRQPRNSKFPPAVIFGHFALAAVGLVLWIVYVFNDSDGLAWTAFVLLLPVAVLGFVMLARWIPTYRARASAAGGTEVAEGSFPPAVVVGHGLFAVATLVLVLLTALEVGGS